MGITKGNDGALWFVEIIGNKVGRITTSGIITEYEIPTLNSRPHAITAGVGNELWFTEWGSNKIGRIKDNKIIEEYPIKTPNAEPHGISSYKGEMIWVALECDKLGNLTLKKDMWE